MPDIPGADQELKQFQASIQIYIDSLQNELSKADSIFIADSVTMNEVQKASGRKN
jgi:hypothetical protein